MGSGWLEHLSALSTEALLDEMRVGSDDVYLLGALNRHITIYSQQTRAINLVHALAESRGGNLASVRIAVVGAGFAGLTAAAYAAKEKLAEVVVIERALRPLWLQDQSTKRWLHPRIYDWPNAGALEPYSDLPVLNWRAGPACTVSAKVRAQWDDLTARNERLGAYYGWRVTSWKTDADKKLQLSVVPEGAGDLALPPSVINQPFDLVVLAVGFGLERSTIGPPGSCPSYWNDVDGLDDLHPGQTIAIVGLGDGGLTDVLRLSIRSFDQGRLVQLVEGLDTARFEALRQSERELYANPAKLHERYRSDETIDQELLERLKSQVQRHHRILLIGKGSPYAPTAAILNRVLLRHLHELKAFELIDGDVVSASVMDGRVDVTYARSGGKTEILPPVDRVLLRLGPQPVWKELMPASIVPVLDERRRHWRTTPQDLDQTRVPLTPRTAHASSRSAALASLPARESGTDPWILVVHPGGASADWKQLSRDILDQLIHQERWSAATTQALVLSSTDAVRTENYAASVRALCSAPVALFDVEKRDPAVMLLLGIRAVVRRGVTLVCDYDTSDPAYWSTLPFNIKDVNPLATNEPTFVQTIAQACSEGRDLEETRPRYLDLPAFEGIRELGTRPADYEPIPQAEEALLLRPFSDSYSDKNLKFLKMAVTERLPSTKLTSVIDERSPQLAGQRLYEAIRRSRLCIADLSGWRPNVLFEAGVRLACNATRPIFLLDPKFCGEALDPQSPEALEALLGAVRYRVPGPNQSIVDAVDRWVSQAEETTTYPITSRYYDFDRDQTTRSLTERLAESAALSLRTDAPEERVDATHLFAGNDEITEVVRRKGIEHLVAAWAHLDAWQDPSSRERSALLDPEFRRVFRKYSRLTDDLARQLGDLRSDGAQRLLARIRARLQDPRFAALQALDRSLSSWDGNRALMAKMHAAGEFDKNQLAMLEDLAALDVERKAIIDELRTIGGPGVTLLLQSLELDGATISRLAKRYRDASS